MQMRKSLLFLLILSAQIILLGAAFLHAGSANKASLSERSERAVLVEKLQLTDLCIFTEARYTRHPSMADLHSAFQDHPGAKDHFPSGSMINPSALRPYAENN
jgi:hypothetical protein